MAQILFKDKIKSLSQAGGTITLPLGSILTIGGQQYTTTSNLQVAANVSLANTRYQVYAVLSGGVPALVVSSNENSVGPTGYTAWKLVGSYYTGVLSQFLQFANISNTPTEIIKEVIDIAGSGNFTGGTILVTRTGNQVNIKALTAMNFPSASSANSAAALLPVWARPSNTSYNLSVFNGSIYVMRSGVGSDGSILVAFRDYAGAAPVQTTSDVFFNISYGIESLNNTPIEDL